MDQGGNPAGTFGVGADNIFGTADDVDVDFDVDDYVLNLNLNIFVLSHTIQVKNQEENIQERIESPLLLPTPSLLSLIIRRKKIFNQVSLRGPITTRYAK
jgi:hypothetical protein